MSATWTTNTKSGRLGDDLGLEGRQMLGALAIQGDFDQGREAGSELVRRQQRDAALDHAGIDQALDAAQTGGR